MSQKRKKLSPISALHYGKLCFRSLLLLLAAGCYLSGRTTGPLGLRVPVWLLTLIWVTYAAEILSRFFPSRLESMGCQKQFRHNFQPTGQEEPDLPARPRTRAAAMAWLLLNAAIGLLYALRVIDAGILLLISLAYGVCDMICILFFCPFQTWFLKNRCCTDCRIYNWDFAMMFTPFVFLPGKYTWSLLALSLLLLLRWEVTLRRHPQRFAARTNAALSCAACQEKLCQHKRQLRTFWAREKRRARDTLAIFAESEYDTRNQ